MKNLQEEFVVFEGKIIELSETEVFLKEIIIDFSIDWTQKIRLIFHYQSILSKELKLYFLYLTDTIMYIQNKNEQAERNKNR